MINKILYVFLAIALITGVARIFINNSTEVVACPADLGMCSDGSTVRRVAPSCQFSACPAGTDLVQDSVMPPADTSFCTMDAFECSDGSFVGRSGPKCEFTCPQLPDVDSEVQAKIDAKADLITVSNPGPYGIVRSGDIVTGKARGNWFFEGSFPVSLTWSGKTIAEGIATAEGEWMTTEFVPFKSVLTFNPDFIIDAIEGDGNVWPLGSLILKKDNPSGLPENDDALEIPISFAP